MLLLVAGLAYQLYSLGSNFSSDRPLEIKPQVINSKRSKALVQILEARKDPQLLELSESQSSYLLQALLRDPELLKTPSGDTEYSEPEELLELLEDLDLQPESLRWEALAVELRFYEGGLKLALTVPYLKKKTHLNLQIEAKLIWPAQEGEIQISSIHIGEKELFKGKFYGKYLKKRIQESIDEEIPQIKQPVLESLRLQPGKLRLKFASRGRAFWSESINKMLKKNF